MGIDSLNIDDIEDLSPPGAFDAARRRGPDRRAYVQSRPACREQDFRFFAVPAKVAGFGTWPVRAFGHVLPSD